MTVLERRDRPSGSMVAAVARELWRARRYVAVTGLGAIAVGLAMSYRVGFPPSVESRSRTVGTASVLALVDTAQSQVVNLGPSTRGATTVLAARARLLATLMVDSPIRERIARRAGIPAGELIAMRPSTLSDRRRRLPPPRVASLSADDPRAHILHVAVNPLPEGEHAIIAVDTRAPHPAAAGRLAAHAIDALKAHLDEQARAEGVPLDRRVVVRQLDPPQATTARVGPSRILVPVVVLLVFVAGCAAIVAAIRLKDWARASRQVDGRREIAARPGSAAR